MDDDDDDEEAPGLDDRLAIQRRPTPMTTMLTPTPPGKDRDAQYMANLAHDARNRLDKIQVAKEDQYMALKCFDPNIRKVVLPHS